MNNAISRNRRRKRKLVCESLESRQLMAGDLIYQNFMMPEATLSANSLMNSAWSHAMAGNHVVTKSIVDEISSLKLDGEQAKLNGYNSGCVFARCYEAALRETGNQSDLESAKAGEYLKLTLASFEGCWQSGYLAPRDLVAQLKKDDDLVPIRSSEEFQALLRKMSE